MEEKLDRRTKKSRKAIQSTFLTLLLHDGFDSITVKTLTEKADISRKTFYLHFTDKNDLLDAIVQEQIRELKSTCAESKATDFIESTIVWFHYFEQKKDFFYALFKSESTVSFRKQLLNCLMEQIGGEIPIGDITQDRDLKIRFLSTAVIGIVESFVMDEINSDCEHIARQVGKLLEENLPFLSNH
ncbi:TetR/AcrR family transcriptional regulator [Paenibacillus sp. NPDC056722]|uniref:TetR/AcrR family transcriptional regulator n=1 Tax=Paenibacillus sp. NPDC056722 TaxID=3345924 RepID=UPI00368F6B29